MNSSVMLCFNTNIKIQDLGFYITKKHYTHPDRMLVWDVFLYVSDGQMEVWEDGIEYIIKEGQFLFLKSGLHHWGEPKTPAGTSWYWIHFFGCEPDGCCQELNSYLSTQKAIEITSGDYNKYIKLPKQGNIIYPKKTEKIFDSMIELFKSTDRYRAITLSLQTTELFLSIFMEPTQAKPQKKSLNTVYKIIKFIEKKKAIVYPQRNWKKHWI